MALLAVAPCAFADAGRDKADRLCERAERAERDARDAERKSAEREKFLNKGKNAFAPQGGAAASADTAAVKQQVRAAVAQARAMLPQLRQGAAAASQDRGVVPGLSQYFSQMESGIGAALQGIEACLDRPESCSPPAMYCPAPPNIAIHNTNSASANFVRQVQDSYRQSANAAYQACRNLSAGAGRDLERLRQESRNAAMQQGAQGGSGGKQFGDADLYLRRAESLKREASQYRLQADGASGIAGYCRSPQRSRPAAGRGQAVVDALKSAGRKSAAPAVGPGATVVNLKAGWNAPWSKGRPLGSDVPPLPKAEGGPHEETALDKVSDYLSEKGPWWWYKAKAQYREANEQMELTEFIASRPKELVKDIVADVIESNLGSVGKTLTTGYKIMSAVKSTGDEVGEIITDAPAVIVHGSEADARELSARADRAPLKFLNEVFDDVTGKLPTPRSRSEYKRAQRDGN